VELVLLEYRDKLDGGVDMGSSHRSNGGIRRVCMAGLLLSALIALSVLAVQPAFAAAVPVYAGQFPAIPSPGSADGQFLVPQGVAVAPDGTVYVADSRNNRIEYFTASGEYLGKWGSLGSGDGQLSEPRDVAVSPDGSVYVADSFNQRVCHFTAAGVFLGAWGSNGTPEGQFSSPAGIEAAPDGTVYVTQQGGARVQHFTADGVLLGSWGSFGAGDGQFNGPIGIAVTPDGTVYVADWRNKRIERFDATGGFLGVWGTVGLGDGQFLWPWGVGAGPDGTVFVADADGHQIQKFTATGDYITKWGSQGIGPGQFYHPTSVAVASDGTVYVCDTSNNRIQYFKQDSRPPETAIRCDHLDAWTNASPVSFTLEATDGPGGSGVANTYYRLNGGETMAYSTDAVHVSAEGTTAVSFWSVDEAGNTETAKTATIRIDTTPPTIDITSPGDQAGYYLHEAVTAAWSASDELSGLAAASGTVAEGAQLDTSMPGEHSFSVSATDEAGNRASKAVTYYVHYRRSALRLPGKPGDELVFKAGRTIPLEVGLTDADSRPVQGATVQAYVAEIRGGIPGTEVAAVAAQGARVGNLFRNVAGGSYVFELSTKGLSAGAYRLRVAYDDGTSTIVDFSLR
jgi:DNA-binding beta-propeller fold protein YncE